MKDKLILIGSTGGIGKQISPMLSEDYNVVGVGSKDIDVCNLPKLKDFFELHNDAKVVINLAGISYNKFLHKYADDEAALAAQINTNCLGAVNVAAACLPAMRAQGYGRIIMMSSVLSEMPVMGAGIYSACKGFIDNLVKSIALENGNKGITANSVQLGYFDAGLLYTIPEEQREVIKKGIALNRWGNISELHKLIKTLIEVEYLTGTNQKLNGGIYFN